MNSIYKHNRQAHNEKAAKEIVPFLIEWFDPKTIVDIGCGIGSWLSVFQKNNIEIQGIDGKHVDKSLLYVSENKILFTDLRADFKLNKKYDLAVCLEVAEHLPEENANKFVEKITNLSDIILWSAAIPGQGGQNHLNEQPHEYWKTKFEKHNYKFYDILRPLIWNNQKVDVWYKQNTFIVVKDGVDIRFKEPKYFLPYFHPDIKFELETIISKLKKKNKELIYGNIPAWFAFKIFIKALFRINKK